MNGAIFQRLEEMDAALRELEMDGRLLEERIRSGQWVSDIYNNNYNNINNNSNNDNTTVIFHAYLSQHVLPKVPYPNKEGSPFMLLWCK